MSDALKLIALSQALVPDAVTGWLDDHPEATTTVEDGSITQAKLASALSSKIDEIDQHSEEIAEIETVTNKAATVVDSEETSPDLDVSDEDGNVILRLVSGEIETKNFSSSYIPKIRESEEDSPDLDVADNNGNVILRLKDGHIQTNEFSSSSFDTRLSAVETSSSSLDTRLSAVETNSPALKLFNPFGSLYLYHHMNQEVSSPYIPAESLYDIRYAHALGFDMIEANTNACSDGVFIVKHGSDYCLGAGIKDAIGDNDYSETPISSVTSTWVRENVRYASTAEKFCGYIPTLDEFCQECRKFGMKVKVSSVEAALVARKYLPDHMIWATDTERGNFAGTIEYIWDSSVSVENCINNCKEIGAPLNIVIPGLQFPNHTDAEVLEMVEAAHANGFTVGVVYPRPSYIIRAARLGIDTIGSTQNSVNLFENGTAKHISNLGDQSLVLADGATYDSTNDVLELPSGSSVYCSADSVVCGVASVVVRYSGTITIDIGEAGVYESLQNYESDGSDYVFLANVLPHKASGWTKWFNITANAATEIYELTCDANLI